MKVSQKQEAEIAKAIREQADALAALIVRAIEANATLVRAAAVTLAVKIARGQENPAVIEVTSQRKLKLPKTKYSDLTSWEDVELMISIDTGEDPVQQKLDD